MLSRSLIAILLLLIPALCFAQVVGSVLQGQGAGITPLYTTTPSIAGSLGIGATGAPTATGGMLQMTSNGNYNTVAQLTNTNAGASSATTFYLTNDTTHYASLQYVSSGYTASGGLVPGDSMVLATSGAGGMELVNAGTAPIRFDVNSSNVGQFNANGLVLPNVTTSSIYFGSATAPNASILGFGAGNGLFMFGGAYYNGSSRVATAANAAEVDANNGVIGFATDTGLTVGSTYAGTTRGYIDLGGVHVSHMWGNVSGYVGSISNGTYYTGSNDTYGYIQESAWPVTLTFGKPFPSGTSAACVATTAAGYAGIMYTNSNSATAITFYCTQGSGTTCATGQWFAYHCFGVG